MNTSLIQRLHDQQGYPVLDADNYDWFVFNTEYSILFFAGDPERHPESHDVAVILPELIRSFREQLAAAIVHPSIERELQQRFRFTRWPSLVFLLRGEYLGVLSGILTWSDYITETRRILAEPVSIPPPFDMGQVCPAT